MIITQVSVPVSVAVDVCPVAVVKVVVVTASVVKSVSVNVDVPPVVVVKVVVVTWLVTVAVSVCCFVVVDDDIIVV